MTNLTINHNPQAEKIILGICLNNRICAMRACQELTPKMFFDPGCRRIFELINELYAESALIDMDSIVVKLKHVGQFVDYKHYLPEIDRLADMGNFTTHVRHLRDNFFKSRLFECWKKMTNDNVHKTVDEMWSIFQAFQSTGEAVETETLDTIVNGEYYDSDSFEAWLNQRVKEYRGGKTITGKSTGFFDLDHTINGLNKSHYVIVAGSSGSGKTTFAIQMMRHLFKNGTKVGFLSFEMMSEQVLQKLISIETNIPFNKIMSGDLSDWEKDLVIEKARSLASNPNLFIQDVPINGLQALRARIKYLAEVKGVEVLFIDYITLINSTHGDTVTEQLEHISKCLRELFLELEITGVVISQLNKASEAESAPMKHHLFGSGQLAKDAHEILMLKADIIDGTRKLFIRKNRFGTCDGMIKFDFNNGIFEEASEIEYQ